MFIYRHPYASPLKEEKVEPAVEGNFFIKDMLNEKISFILNK